MDRLKASYDTISILEKDKDSANRMHQEAHRMIRVMTVMREYIAECDDAYGEERAILPLGRYVSKCLIWHGCQRVCTHEMSVVCHHCCHCLWDSPSWPQV